MAETSNAVELRNLTKRFKDFTALDDVCLEVRTGTTLGLLGPNGAGKSTTLKLMVGLLRPTSGDATILGHSVVTESALIRKRVGIVPECNQFYRWMTVNEAIRFVRAMFENWNDRLVTHMLEIFELRKSQRIRDLSSGMLSKLSLLLSLAHEPELLILDEPLTGLDPIAREEFMNAVKQDLTRNAMTIIFSSHQMDEVSCLADSVAILFAGRVLVHRNLDKLVSSVRRVRASHGHCSPSSVLNGQLIRQQQLGDEWLMTIDNYECKLASILESQAGFRIQSVEELSLEEIYKELIHGAKKSCSQV
jgi:ABC-2 type transport system ATP-binding protein